MTTRLPVLLDNIRIATPCTADWDEMSGTDKVRFCGQCEKNVYNLSAMTRHEAESLVAKKDGRVCVRLYQRKDGTVLTADCPVGVRRARLRQRVWASVSGFAASVAIFLGVAGGRARADLDIKNGNTAGQRAAPVKMGKMAPPDPVKPPKKVDPAPPAVMGEPMMMPTMGDISPPEAHPAPAPKKTAKQK